MRIRTLIAIAVLAGVSASCASAQGTTVGITAGPSLSAILFDDPYASDEIEARTAAHVRVTLARELSRVFEVETGIGVTRTGFVDIGAHLGSISMDVVQVPVTVRAGFTWNIAPYLKAGLVPTLTLRCRVTDSVIADAASCGDPLVGTDYARFDLAGIGGIGVLFPLARGEALVEITGTLGLRDIKQQPYPPGGARSIGIQLGIGYRVPLDRLFH